MSCETCSKWATEDRNVYSDGTVTVTRASPAGKGLCSELNIETLRTFGCVAHTPMPSADTSHATPPLTRWTTPDHARMEKKEGAPWQHFKMIPCPDCAGIKLEGAYSSPAGGRGHRCAGTGLVRLYDDGYVGDEQTRMHPKEKEFAEAQRKAEELAARGESDKLDPSSLMGV